MSGSYSETFPITAPPTVGTYNAYFIAYSDDGCSNQASNTFTLTGAVTATTNAAPTLTALSPNNGIKLQAPFDVVLTGTNFGTVTTVNFGSGITVNATTVTDSTQMSANITITSTAATGTRLVTVSNPAPGGGTSAGQTFTVNNPDPTLTARTPTSGNRLQTLSVILTGTGFISGTSTVSFSGAGVTVNTTTVDSATQITVNITIASTAATGTRTITVTNPGPGGGSSGTQDFAINNPAPTLTAVNPTSGARTQTLSVVLTGTNFISGVSTVSFGPNITVNTMTVDSSTQITANITIANGAALGARSVSVANAAPAGGAATLTNGFTVTAANAAPVCATPQTGSTLEDNALSANLVCTDANADTLTYSRVANATNGNAIVNPNGSFTYTPNANFFGTDSFTFKANDGTADSNTATFQVTVNAVNDEPTLNTIGDATILEDAVAQTVNLSGITSGPSNESAQTLTVTATSSNTGLIPNPTVTYTSPNTTGSLSYQPVANQFGSAIITVTVTDNGGIANGGDNTFSRNFTVTVTAVNDAPSFTAGPNQTVLEDAGAQTVNPWATAISAGPANESGQTVSFVITNNTNAGLFSAGPAVSPSGVLTYTPAANANGSATITLKITDDGGTANGGVNQSATQSFTITVTAVNDAPAADAQSVSVFEDSVDNLVTLTGSTGPSNESGQTLTFVLETLPTNGTLSETPAGTAIAAGDLPLVLSNATLYFTPTSQTAPPPTPSTSMSPITAAPPTAASTRRLRPPCRSVSPASTTRPASPRVRTSRVLEDPGAATVSGWATDISAGPTNESGQTVDFVVTNDNNALFSSQPAVSPDGTLTFTPAANANGSATVTVKIHDDGGTANGGVDTSATQTFTITVTAVNDAPSFTAGPNQTVLEDAGAQTVNPWATAISTGPANESGQTVSFVITNNTNAGLFSAGPAVSPSGVLTYTPAANANGSATITLKITDDGGTANGGVNQSATQSFTITVTAVNDAPAGSDMTLTALEDQDYTFGVADFGFSDPDDSPPNTFVAVIFTTLPTAGSLELNGAAVTAGQEISTAAIAAGELTFLAAADANGTAYTTFTFQVRDGGGTADFGVDTDQSANTATFDVTPVNDAPTIDGIANETVNEDAVAQTVNLSGITSGPSNENTQTLTVTATSSNTALIPHPTVTYSSPNAIGSLSYQPVANQFGSATITVTVTDNGGTANGGDNTTTTTFTITVNSVNDAPSFTKGANQSVLEDSGAATISGWATDISAGPTNESGQTVDFVVTNDNNALFSSQPAVSPGGTLTFTPAANANGSATVTVNIHDDGGTANGGVDTSATQTFTITVTAVNDAPAGTDGSATINEDASYTFAAADFGFTDPFDDPDDGFLGVVITTLPSAGTLTLDGDPVAAGDVVLVSELGDLLFSPAANANGSPYASFTFQVRDDGGTANGGVDTSATQTFTITVTAVNDAPAGTDGSATINEDASYTFAAADFGFTDPFDDPDDGFLGVVITTLPSAGTLTLDGDPVAAGDVVLVSELGDLLFSPAANANGSPYASFTFQVRDDGGTANGGVDSSATQTFTITVTAVNDAPSFTKGADQTVLEDSGASLVTGWATNISAGPANESSQTVQFLVSNDNNSLFSGQPAVSPGGTLTYTPAANAFGSPSSPPASRMTAAPPMAASTAAPPRPSPSPSPRSTTRRRSTEWRPRRC